MSPSKLLENKGNFLKQKISRQEKIFIWDTKKPWIGLAQFPP